MEHFSLLIRDGRVIDPANGRDERADVAVHGGKIAGVGDFSGAAADRVVMAAGCVVTPGWIDDHAHLWPLSNIGIPADAACLPGCVTTVADGGSAGCATYALHRPALMGLRVTPKIFLHVCSAGLAGFRALQENIDPACFDAAGISAVVEKYPQEIVGLKIRMGRETAGNLGLSPLIAARDLAHQLGLPLMVHCTDPAMPLAELIDCLGKGDILTHPYNGKGHTLMEPGGFRALAAARARGVILDVGDAGVHTSFAIMREALGRGLGPDTISTDSTDRGVFNERGGFSLPFSLSKWLNLGMPLPEAIACVTANPASALGISQTAGALAPGRAADIAVLRETRERVTFYDGVKDTLAGERLLRPLLTVKEGAILYRDIGF